MEYSHSLLKFTVIFDFNNAFGIGPRFKFESMYRIPNGLLFTFICCKIVSKFVIEKNTFCVKTSELAKYGK